MKTFKICFILRFHNLIFDNQQNCMSDRTVLKEKILNLIFLRELAKS